MTVNLSYLGGAGWQFFDNNGVPLSGGLLYTYAAGTTTPAATYTSYTGATPNPNPIVLDSAGRPPAQIWVTSDQSLKFTLKTSVGVELWTKDNIPAFSTASSADLSFIAAGTGAVTRTAQAKMRDFVSVKDYGATGDGTTDDTTAVQTAINTGFDIYFPAGNYRVNNLTQSTNFQRFHAQGQVNLVKNANGVLFTSTGNYVEFDGVQFVGTGYTGDNINSTGSNPRFINCSSYGTPGRALKATGSHVQIIGTCGTYTTTDATASGYDIEIGVSGTATLYHQLYGVYTSQATGGILLTDTGSHSIVGGQFGKLTIAAGTTPAGSNGGMTTNARILGNVSVGLSNSTFSGNQFGVVTITLAAGTSQHTLDSSNNLVNATIVNNGNSNSPIIKSVGTGSPTGIALQYGPDATNSVVRYSQDAVYFQNSDVYIPNNKSLYSYDSGGSAKTLVNVNASNNVFLGNDFGGFTSVSGGAGGIYLAVSGTSITHVHSGGFRPAADGTYNLGNSFQRWATVYATTGTINTSDRNEKQDIENLSDAEKRVGTALKSLIRKFRFKDAVALKGKNARIHVGVIAQDVEAAFKAEGLDPTRYGVFCADKMDNGTTRYGVRYEELLAFIIGAL